MNILALFGYGLVMVILQTTGFRLLGLSYLKAPLVLAVVIYAAFYLAAARGLPLSFLLGYAMDVFSGGMQGVTPLVMVFLCLLGQWMRRGIVVEGKLALGFVALLFGMIYGVLWVGIETLLGSATSSEGIPFVRIFFQAMVLSALSPLLVGGAAAIDRLVGADWRRRLGQRTWSADG